MYIEKEGSCDHIVNPVIHRRDEVKGRVLRLRKAAAEKAKSAKANRGCRRKGGQKSGQTDGLKGNRNQAKSSKQRPQLSKASRLRQTLLAIYAALRRLTPAPRRLLLEELGEAERRDLESWIVREKRDAEQKVGGDLDIAARPEVAVEGEAADEAEDELDSSSGEMPPHPGPASQLSLPASLLSICDGSGFAIDDAGCSKEDACTGEAEADGEAVNDDKSIKGISKFTLSNVTYYAAAAYISPVRMRTRSVRDLQSAVEHFVVLTAIRLRLSTFKGLDTLMSHMEAVVQEVLKEHGVTGSSLGLHFVLEVHRSWLLPRVLLIPRTYDVCQLLQIMHSLSRFLQRMKPGRVAVKNIGPILLQRELQWPDLRAELLSILEKGGKKFEASKLDNLFAATALRRQQLWEIWNRHVMAREERRQRRLDSSASRAQFLREQKNQRATERVLARARRLLQRWRSLRADLLRVEQGRERRRALRLRRQQQAAAQASARDQQRAELKRKKLERQARWRWMNRRDITMEEIMSGRKMCKLLMILFFCADELPVSS